MAFDITQVVFHVSQYGLSRHAVAILPGECVSSFRLALPKLNAVKLQKTLPFILSDALITAPSALHFCVLDKTETADLEDPSENEERVVLACDREILREVREAARQKGFTLDAIWPDFVQISRPKDGVAIVEQEDRLLCRFADGRGFCSSALIADAMLGDAPRIASGLGDALPIGAGFATGVFGKQLDLAAYAKLVRKPAMWLGGGILIWLAITMASVFEAHRQIRQLERAATAQFRAHAPDVKRIVNIEVQLRNMLASQGVGLDAFSRDMTTIFKTVANMDDARIEEIRFDQSKDTTSEVVFGTSSYSAVEVLRRELEAEKMTVRVGSSLQEGDVIKTTFNIKWIGR